MSHKSQMKIFVLILTLILISISVEVVSANTYTEYTARVIATNGLNVRKDKTSNSEIVGFLSYNELFKYTDDDVYEKSDENICNSWIYVGTKNGYVCQDYIEVTATNEINDYSDTEMTQMTDEEFDAYLTSQGFDDTYKDKLKELHNKYPSWVFVGIKTNRDWQSTVEEESKIGYSTYYIDAIRESAGQEAYLSTESHYDWTTNIFTGYDGYFFLANEKTVAYFLDPRNYLNEANIFMFETLNFNDTYQDKDKIATILGTDQYSDYIYEAGKEYNYSPIAIAIKIKQEGTLNNRTTNGTTEVYCTSGVSPQYDLNGTKFAAPLYNFFNIGATSSPTNADLNGLCYAATTNSNYLLPWDTPEKAIKGGTKWIASQYVQKGQYTNYFQKFNVSNPNTEIWHQYMTNLEDPKSQSIILYNLYAENSMLKSPFVFYIPIYNDMPESTQLPKAGNPNNWLTSLTVNIDGVTSSVSNFSGDNTSYTINVSSNVKSITINSTTVARTSYVSIDGSESVLKTSSKQVVLADNENNFDIIVTAGNGDTKTYSLTVIKEEAPSEQPTIEEVLEQANLKQDENYISGLTFGIGTTTLTDNLLKINSFATIQITNHQNEVKTTGPLGTGDKITITSNSETKTFEIIIFGDINGDGDITNIDLLTVQKHIWKDTNLADVYLKAADIDKDGQVTNADLLRIQKHIWKDLIIAQN